MSDINQPLSPEARDWLMRHQASTRLELPLLTNACHLVMAAGETASSPYSASMLQQGLRWPTNCWNSIATLPLWRRRLPFRHLLPTPRHRAG